jgi:serine/threonine protein kinase
VHSLLEASAAEETESATRSNLSADPKSAAEARRIGPYQVDSLLGRGGMGAVYLAHRADGHFEQKVAIKLIDLPLATEVFRERFRQERQILAGLQHPYIARLLDGGVTQNGDLYLAMEYVDGVPIHSFCNQQHLSLPERIELFIRVCEAVQFAHQNLVVHRDLKPDNIYLVRDDDREIAKVLDFGIAKSAASALEGSNTKTGAMLGTPYYMSPEQAQGMPLDARSDLYSTGVILFEMLSGTRPYSGSSALEVMQQHVTGQRPPLPPDCAGLEPLLDRMMARNRADRFADAGELRAALDNALAQQLPPAAQTNAA